MSLNNQFVTSFSELYIRGAAFTDANGNVIGTSSAPNATDVRNWFVDTGTGATSKVQPYTVSGTIVAGTTVYRILDAENNGNVLETRTLITTGTTATTFATTLAADLSLSVFISTAVSAAAVITVSFEADASDALIEIVSTTAGAVLSAGTATTAFIAGDNATMRIPLVMEIGTLSNEATIIDTPTFGEEFRGKLRGQLDGGQLDTQLYWAPRNSVHQLIRQFAQRGTAVSVGIEWRPTTDATADMTELVVFDSFVSSFGIDTTFDDVAKASATMVVDGAEHFASGDLTVNTL